MYSFGYNSGLELIARHRLYRSNQSKFVSCLISAYFRSLFDKINCMFHEQSCLTI